MALCAAGVLAGHLPDLTVERGREEHRLPLARQPPDDAVDLRSEAHVEHPVGLVEHQDANGVERDHSSRDEVLEAAGRRDEDVGRLRTLRLGRDADAAENRGDGELRADAIACEVVGDLGCELAGRNQDQGGRLWLRADSSRRSTIGTAKASVFPEPVGDFAEDVEAGERVGDDSRSGSGTGS